MFERFRSFNLLAMIFLSVAIPAIYCGNACGYPNIGVPSVPSPLIPTNMSAFITMDNEEDMELFQAIANPSSNLANMAGQSIDGAMEIVDGVATMAEVLSELMPIVSGFIDIFSGILSLFGFGSNEGEKFMQAMSAMCQQVLQDAERYTDQEIAQNAIQQLQANFQTASDNFNAVANSPLIADDEISLIQDAETLLDLNYNLFQDQEILSTYSYFSFNTLYINAMLHMNAYSTLITYYLNNSQLDMTLSTASAAQTHAAEYYTLLQNYANQAQSWRLQFITDIESENEAVITEQEELWGVCMTNFSDSYISVQYQYCSTEVCEEEECFYVTCGEEGSEEEYANECRNGYYNNLQSALSAYYNQYINSFYPFYQQFQSVQIPLTYSHQNNNTSSKHNSSSLTGSTNSTSKSNHDDDKTKN